MIISILVHLLIIVVLTVLTQVGGIVYFLTVIVVSKKNKYLKVRRLALFGVLYLLVTFLALPLIAPFFGREKIEETDRVIANSFLYKLANRNYVTPRLNGELEAISKSLEEKHKGVKLVYLDANFPFIDGFPLLPHLSHNDGKKVDLCFIYSTPDGELVNEKPSVSGYGVFEGPAKNEYDQISACKAKGYWQYDYAQYLTLGQVNNGLEFSQKGTKALVKSIISQRYIRKVFIEPHLKQRMGLQSNKVRYHGCQAVRHDDHIHIQL